MNVRKLIFIQIYLFGDLKLRITVRRRKIHTVIYKRWFKNIIIWSKKKIWEMRKNATWGWSKENIWSKKKKDNVLYVSYMSP